MRSSQPTSISMLVVAVAQALAQHVHRNHGAAGAVRVRFALERQRPRRCTPARSGPVPERADAIAHRRPRDPSSSTRATQPVERRAAAPGRCTATSAAGAGPAGTRARAARRCPRRWSRRASRPRRRRRPCAPRRSAPSPRRDPRSRRPSWTCSSWPGAAARSARHRAGRPDSPGAARGTQPRRRPGAPAPAPSADGRACT